MDTTTTKKENPYAPDNAWNEGFLRLAESYKETFFSMETEEYFKMISGTTVTIECWVQIYFVMANLKLLERIEDLPEEQKNTLWRDAKTYMPGDTKERTIKLCKVIHAISTYIQL
jgi:hypothetical protein